MTTSILRALAACALCLPIFATAGCGSARSDGASTLLAPQTGSFIGRRVWVEATPGADAPAEEAKANRKKTKPEQPQTQVDEEYITRGGFR